MKPQIQTQVHGVYTKINKKASMNIKNAGFIIKTLKNMI
jgi:hypothetical protein